MLRETEIALANLGWLIDHLDARLDYAAGAVFLGVTEEPEFLLADLTIPGLTPATEAGAWDQTEVTFTRMTNPYGLAQTLPAIPVEPPELTADEQLSAMGRYLRERARRV